MKSGRKNFKIPSSHVVTVSPSTIAHPGYNIGHVYPFETISQVSDLAEQFQNFLSTQPHVIYASSIKGLTPFNLSGISSSMWIFDSGASHHMSYDHKSFAYLNLSSSISIMTTNGTSMPVAGVGYVSITNLSLFVVYYILNLTLSLASVSQLCDSNYPVVFSSISCYAQDSQPGRKIRIGRTLRRLYVLVKLKVPDTTASTFIVDLSSFCLNSSSTSFYLWYSRPGHVSSSS